MKKFGSIILIAASVSCNAQISPPHSWEARVRVLDDANQPVAGAEVTIGFQAKPPPGGNRPPDEAIRGTTDTNGIFAASHTDQSHYLSFQAKKSGYYPFGCLHEVGFSPQEHPERLKPQVTLVLKPIVKPIPMFAKSVNLGMPAFDKPVGYDLMVGDWVAPYGKGLVGDLIFTAKREKRSDFDSDYQLNVSFPNHGDGIQIWELPEVERVLDGSGSGLRSPHEAPTGNYQPKWVQTIIQRPGVAMQSNRDYKRIYFFRVRTALDKDRRVVSALYGKIYGDFMQFTYYLNPTPNDRNIEFDPARNLLSGQRVPMP